MSSIPTRSTATKVVVASTVMLAFISFWRAAAIVLNDLASSVFYVGGIVEQAIGQCPVVHSCRHAVQLRRAVDLHGKQQHVCTWRRLRCRSRRHGAVCCAPFRIRTPVRLHSDRTDQQRERRPVSRATHQ